MTGRVVASRQRAVKRRAEAIEPRGSARLREDVCLELTDYTVVRYPAVRFFRTDTMNEPRAQAARLAGQFIDQNHRVLDLMDVAVEPEYDGRDVMLRVESQGTVGAVPLVSPTTGQLDFGLVVQPRFPWPGIGPMLAEMGWLVAPAPLRLPLLKRSTRKVPRWVISVMVLARLRALLDRLERRFETTEQTRRAPKGTVLWQQYASRNLPRAQFLAVPCRYPDLRDDRELKGAIRMTLELQIRSLESQVEHGAFVHQLIALADSLLQRVQGVPTLRPPHNVVESWLRRPLRVEQFMEGIQAIDWTMEERGLAGTSDLEGIPWRMPMDLFFEAWVETVLRRAAVRTGGQLKAGRKRETVSPLAWEPPYMGSQKSLVPDLMLQLGDCTLIVDAKYKRHWEELQHQPWAATEEGLREQHRHDILQVLAYTSLAETPSVICCLAYACFPSTWERLRDQGRLFHVAEVPSRSRRVTLWLTAVPMKVSAEQAATPLAERIRSLVRE